MADKRYLDAAHWRRLEALYREIEAICDPVCGQHRDGSCYCEVCCVYESAHTLGCLRTGIMFSCEE